jgi:hypothetical protein
VAQTSELFFYFYLQKLRAKSTGLRLDGRQDLEKLKTAKPQKLIANG